MGALVQQSINDSKISGGDRPVAWDGETRSGAGLQNQLKQIQESKVSPLSPALTNSAHVCRLMIRAWCLEILAVGLQCVQIWHTSCPCTNLSWQSSK